MQTEGMISNTGLVVKSFQRKELLARRSSFVVRRLF